MFSLSYTTKSELVGTIRVKKPISCLGPLTDIDGKKWDIRAIFGKNGKQIVNAVEEYKLHPYYRDTSNSIYEWISQRWEPYEIEVV